MGVGWAETVGVQTVLLIPVDICLCCYKRYEFGATCMTLLASLHHGYKKKSPSHPPGRRVVCLSHVCPLPCLPLSLQQWGRCFRCSSTNRALSFSSKFHQSIPASGLDPQGQGGGEESGKPKQGRVRAATTLQPCSATQSSNIMTLIKHGRMPLPAKG